MLIPRCCCGFPLGLVFLAMCSTCIGQNLIPNGGFEYFYRCPDNHDQLSNAVGWLKCNTATPDYFNRCNAKGYRSFGVPANMFGYKHAFAGDGYAGLVCQLDFREYIMIRLKEPLKEGKSYHASMYVSLSPAAEFAIAEFGMYFSQKPIFRNSTDPITNLIPQIRNDPHRYLFADDWYKIQGTFTATGGEQFVMIGNFVGGTRTQPVTPVDSIISVTKKAYYYIDNVSTEPVKKPRFIIPESGEIQALDHIYFEVDKAALLTQSHSILDELSNIMKRFPTLKIEIIGHADEVGDAIYNQTLSETRALMVKKYLVSKGISANRLRSSGKGSTAPLAPNTTEKDRQLNRRVEFRVIE